MTPLKHHFVKLVIMLAIVMILLLTLSMSLAQRAEAASGACVEMPVINAIMVTLVEHDQARLFEAGSTLADSCEEGE